MRGSSPKVANQNNCTQKINAIPDIFGERSCLFAILVKIAKPSNSAQNFRSGVSKWEYFSWAGVWASPISSAQGSCSCFSKVWLRLEVILDIPRFAYAPRPIGNKEDFLDQILSQAILLPSTHSLSLILRSIFFSHILGGFDVAVHIIPCNN